VGQGRRSPAGRAGLRRKADKPDSRLLANDLASLGGNPLNQGRWSEAEPLLRECLRIREKAVPDDWSRYDAMSLLGGALLSQGGFDVAEPLVVEGYEGIKALELRITVPERFRRLEAAVRVVPLYEEWGKAKKAHERKRKLGLADLPSYVFATP
jgi:hypothetical protein